MTSPFELLPAIDLREGRVVRLRQGDFDQETAFSDDPVAVAVGFAANGAAWLHVVDLDGARTGTPTTPRSLEPSLPPSAGRSGSKPPAASGQPTRCGRCSRQAPHARSWARPPSATRRSPTHWSKSTARNGWQSRSTSVMVRPSAAAGSPPRPGRMHWSDRPACRPGCHDIRGHRDRPRRPAARPGPRPVRSRGRARKGRIIASAGITSKKDVAAVRAIGCAGAIIGRALYEGQLSLQDALSVTDSD